MLLVVDLLVHCICACPAHASMFQLKLVYSKLHHEGVPCLHL